MGPPTPLLACLLATALTSALGGYIITTPRRWVSDAPAQVCVTVMDDTAPASTLNLVLGDHLNQHPKIVDRPEVLVNTTITVPAGQSNECHEVVLPRITQYSTKLRLTGSAGGSKVNHTVQISLKRDKIRTFLQTDKYLYKPGQLVQLRALTIVGPEMAVSTKRYPEVWVTTPSRTRVAQWKNVNNSAGLVHLDFRLADEPEKGVYTINSRSSQGHNSNLNFKVEDFVLPRFEVTLRPPPFILATDQAFTFTVCANYTFGQPVKGMLSMSVSNGQNRKCRVKVTRNVTISGCAEVETTTAEMRVTDCNVYFLRVKATVTEDGTGVEQNTSRRTSISRNSVSFKTVYTDSYMKPNLPFTLKVRAELPDGTVAVGVPMEVCAAGQCTNLTTSPDGLFTAILPSYHSFGIHIKALNCRADMYSSEFSESLTHYFSPSNSSLLIHAPEGKLACTGNQSSQHILPVLFSARDQPSATITVQIVSRGRIQHSSSREYQLVSGPLPINTQHLVEPLPPLLPGTVRGVVNITINLPQTASPTAQVLVWYTRKDGEVVSDTKELQMDKCLPHDVTLSWSTERAQPGDAAIISLTSEPDSVCSLGVVDRSSELLAVDPDPINLNKLFSFANRFKISRYDISQIDDHRYCEGKYRPPAGVASDIVPIRRYNYYTDYVDALKMFDIAGVYVFTDYTTETRPCEKDEYFGFAGIDLDDIFQSPPAAAEEALSLGAVGATGAAGGSLDREGEGEGSTTTADVPRTNFPETWLWDLVVTPSSGVSEKQVTLPDTITQWVGKAVCVHPQKGVGLSARQPITAFTPFFVDLTLPPTMKRGEVLPVKMSVFNYLDQPLPVSLTLEDSPEYEIIEEAGVVGQRGKRSACVPPQDKTVLTVKIRPMEIADVNISVSAAVDQQSQPTCGAGLTAPARRDALIKPIKVEAEGFLRENTWSKYICSKDFETGEDSLEAWELSLPVTLVEGSARGWVTAVGDLLALSLENLGGLIRMPYGCGEQNMLNFAPNIFILRYLETTNQTTPEARDKLINFMKTGYRRELLYRRNDGSYSAFGNADDSGSTWLTAFVLKSFAQAKKYILIDEDLQVVTSNWLKRQQGPDGCFNSVGKLLHKGMQGGVSKSKTPVPLTAYVMAALLEANETATSEAVSLAARCLASDSSSHPYTLALKAYALALARHPGAAAAVQQLLDLAVVAKNSIHWNLPPGPGSSRAAAVETAGYAILAMMTHDPKNMEQQARKVVKWITAQRNGQGGFYSTQDTVVALQAMAVYEGHLHQGPLNVQATMTATNFSHVFTVTDDNKLLEQLKPLPSMPTTVSINMTGQGCAVLQAVQRYNIPDPEPSDAFDLTVNTITVPDNLCVTKRITACASYRLADSKSNMAVIEVDLISGYIPEKDDLKQLLKDDRNLKRYEVDGSKVTFYIDELSATDTCVNFRVIREVTVEEVKAGTVVVYDYYQPEFSISKRYTLPPPEECR